MIEKGIPITPVRGGSIYGLEAMKPGDSQFFTGYAQAVARVKAAVQYAQRKTGAKFSTRVIEGGIRVWMTHDTGDKRFGAWLTGRAHNTPSLKQLSDIAQKAASQGLPPEFSADDLCAWLASDRNDIASYCTPAVRAAAKAFGDFLAAGGAA